MENNLTPHGLKKTKNTEVNRSIEQFEVNFLHEILCNPEDKEVLKIYDSEGNWNLFLIGTCKESYFVAIPKKENSCKPCIYGSVEHTNEYNYFNDLKN